MKDVFSTWWPLAASWLLMGFEQPAASAVMTRLPDPIHALAAFGGIVFPIGFVIEAPIIMLLAASTALSRDAQSYRLGLRMTHAACAVLTVVHALVAFTPAYDAVVTHLLQAPEAIVEPGRLGLRILLPWTWAIGYRRFQQGLLIRTGRSRLVGAGTAVRLVANGAALVVGWAAGWPGIAVGTGAVAAGVIVEAVFAGVCVRPALREVLAAPVRGEPLSVREFVRFYVPLAMTPLITLLSIPMASAAMGRMPLPVESLAVWPVLNGLLFALRAIGIALNEVAVALLDRPGAREALSRFTLGVAAGGTVLLLVTASTPLAGLWFEDVSGLSPDLGSIALTGMWIAVAGPALSAWQHWFQGIVVRSGRTRGVTEAVAVGLAVTGLLLWAGVEWGGATGLYVAVAATMVGNAALVAWLRIRAAEAWTLPVI
jgi:hypothetical protein